MSDVASNTGRRAAALALALVMSAASGVARSSADTDFMAAREAFRTGNVQRLDALAARLDSHVLRPYVAYWQLRARLDQAQPDEVRALIGRLADGPLAERLRIDWLKALGRREQWGLFQLEYDGVANPDTELVCYALQRRIGTGDAAALREARELWLAARPSPPACTPVFEVAIKARAIDPDDVWARMRLALQAGQTTLAKRLADYLPARDGFDAKLLDSAAANPQRYLERANVAAGGRGAREIALFALDRLSRSSHQQAAARWRALAPQFTEEERGYLWGQLALRAALRHDPEALDWFARAGALTDLQLAWRARAALRIGQWAEVLDAINAMSAAERADPTWRYWKARALKVQGRTTEANALLAPLSTEHHFYGLLAAEDLGDAIAPPADRYRPSEQDLRAIEALPSIQRALALYRLGLRFEANREWIWTVRPLDDRQLLAAAELARRHQLWDRAINTAELTRSLHDFELRYLAPYRDVFSAYARQNDLDEAWIFGLVRQESRFIHDARSHAGASGLMQLMPATARWVAGKMGMQGFRQSAVNELDVNISLGTYYLRHVFETLDYHPVLASAAYNAGPGRARAWRPSDEIDAAVYSETIPFNETRDYVKKVMANATFYARSFGQSLVSLRQRIGTVPAPGGGSPH